MPGTLTFGLLGPVQASVDGTTVPIAGRHTQALLAALLLERDNVLPVDRLIDAVWGEAPPSSARTQVQNRVAALRRFLRERCGADGVIETQGSGYLIRTGQGPLDVDLFEERVRAAEECVADGVEPAAAETFSAALSLWRGYALDGLESPALRGAAHRLDERRTAVRVRWAELEIKLGRAPEALGELTALIARYPWHEQAVGQLMTALHASNRHGEALLVFDQLRKRLTDELGVEPGPELSRLRDRILRNDPTLNVATPVPSPPPTASAGEGTVPRQLPGDVPVFVGRTDQMRQLDALLPDPDHTGSATAVIVVIEGSAGIGKTTLAVHWAHRAAGHFGDGQLYVNLRGFDPGGTSLSPAQALRGLLESLRVPAQRVPVDFDAQVGLYRSIMADRRALVVLDNARDVDQVRPLLPGSPGCLTVVTSRNRLSSLVAKEGARLFGLDLLSPAEAHHLFALRVGGARVVAEPQAAEVIVERCTGLPLALAVVAARVMTHEDFPLASLAGELRDAVGRLDAFDIGAADTDVRVVFSWSYRALSSEAANLFRLLGLHPGPHVTTAAAASLAGVPVRAARTLLAELARAHMIMEQSPGRFTMHDLLWAYSRELAQSHDAGTEHRTAVGRMFDHYLHTARAVALLLNPHRDPIDVSPPVPGATPEDITDPEEAGTWLTAERPTLLAMVRTAADTHFETHSWQLAWTVTDALDRRGQWPDLATAQWTALDATHRASDPVGQAHAHHGLARAYSRLGMLQEAHDHLRLALDLFHESGDDVGQAYVHRGLGAIFEWQGRNVDALRHDEQALELCRRAGHRPGQASALNSIGWCHAQLGNHGQALSACRQALALHREVGNRHGEASTLDSLGYVYHHVGDHRRAATCYEKALHLFRGIGDRYYEADTLTHLGDTRHAAGDTAGAEHAWRTALDILEALGHHDAATVRTRLTKPTEAQDIA